MRELDRSAPRTRGSVMENLGEKRGLIVGRERWGANENRVAREGDPVHVSVRG